MINLCESCGAYQVKKEITVDGKFAICPVCKHPQSFRRLPLFVVTGASGVGKTTLCMRLQREFERVIVMESDILWSDEFNTPADNYHRYRELWLRMCKNIAQNGTPVLLCGCVTPEQFECCAERRYFSDIHYLAVVSTEEKLRARMTAGRKITDGNHIKSSVDFNQWFWENADNITPSITLLDTTLDTTEQSLDKIKEWIGSKL